MSEELIPKAAWIAWGIIGVAYAAACVWIGVRLFNRRERWTKWTAVALAVMPTMYVLSSGPITMVAFQSRVTHTPMVLPDGIVCGDGIQRNKFRTVVPDRLCTIVLGL